MKISKIYIFLSVFLFALFPLTDTDIWWHLSCAREWVTTWTPMRLPIVNVHEFFQKTVYLIYNFGGAKALVFFKALLWGFVFILFLNPLKKVNTNKVILSLFVVIFFIFRFQFEIRPILFSLLFLGIYWNLIPKIWESKGLYKSFSFFLILILQWVWCKVQGLYILGTFFVIWSLLIFILKNKVKINYLSLGFYCIFGMLIILMPFMHKEGLNLFLYPFELLNRLVGISDSAVIFSSTIAENRSFFSLLLSNENKINSFLAIVIISFTLLVSIYKVCYFFKFKKDVFNSKDFFEYSCIFVIAILALIAERNFVLFLPFFAYFICNLKVKTILSDKMYIKVSLLIVFFVMGIWCKSFLSYNFSFISKERVPILACEWMKSHPHRGKLFNDDRVGGYLSFMNPADSIYIDGRFILKSSDFFKRYMLYTSKTDLFLKDADSLGIDRTIFPLKYYAKWDNLLKDLLELKQWKMVYKDDFFVVLDKN